jgi:hypothetical protein
VAVTGTPKKSAGEVKGRLNVALYLPDSVRCLSVAVPAVDSAGMAAGDSIAGPIAVVPIPIAVRPIAVVPIPIGVGPVAVVAIAVAIISVAIISMAICTPMMSAVDASNAPGC